MMRDGCLNFLPSSPSLAVREFIMSLSGITITFSSIWREKQHKDDDQAVELDNPMQVHYLHVLLCPESKSTTWILSYLNL